MDFLRRSSETIQVRPTVKRAAEKLQVRPSMKETGEKIQVRPTVNRTAEKVQVRPTVKQALEKVQVRPNIKRAVGKVQSATKSLLDRKEGDVRNKIKKSNPSGPVPLKIREIATEKSTSPETTISSGSSTPGILTPTTSEDEEADEGPHPPRPLTPPSLNPSSLHTTHRRPSSPIPSFSTTRAEVGQHHSYCESQSSSRSSSRPPSPTSSTPSASQAASLSCISSSAGTRPPSQIEGRSPANNDSTRRRNNPARRMEFRKPLNARGDRGRMIQRGLGGRPSCSFRNGTLRSRCGLLASLCPWRTFSFLPDKVSRCLCLCLCWNWCF